MDGFKLQSMNWRDGMLLTMGHLRAQESYFEELVRWHAFNAGDQYGLAKKDPLQPPLRLHATMSGSRLRVEVSRCQALLPSGMAVEFTEATSGGGVLKVEADVNKTRVPVFLGVNPGEKQQVGDPDPSEEVPRVPYEIPAYRLTLGEPPNLPETMYIQIAMLAVSGSEVSPASDYFPPCVSINADERLSAVAVEWRSRLASLLKLATRAYEAAWSDEAPGDTSKRSQDAIRGTLYFLVYDLASTLDDLAVNQKSIHPGVFIMRYKKLLRVVSTLLNLHPGFRDSLNEDFFTREMHTDIMTWSSAIDSLLLSSYDHRDIARQVGSIHGFLGNLAALMAYLSQTTPSPPDELVPPTFTYRGKTFSRCDVSGWHLEERGEANFLVIDLAAARPMKDVISLIKKTAFADDQWQSMQIRVGINDARGLGVTDPVDADLGARGSTIVLHSSDINPNASVRQVTFIFRGMHDPKRLADLGRSDVGLYFV